ncbi:MAG TPA: non-canonical purine NTP pyrophosphatase [Deltaproteobacteria bacterium]|nr:non-canonical purine NTP pyrophosphatase [Deltaproteobacteria bacterium]
MKPRPQIVVATRNAGKWREIQRILAEIPVDFRSLEEFPMAPEVEETGQTYLENARLKARALALHCGTWALADDSGLEVAALEGKPGVHSARYAGEKADAAANNRKLLFELQGLPPEKRQARFRCVLVLAHPDGREVTAEGELFGQIATELRGEHGFGYDPLFLLPERGQTLAELNSEEKNRLSHRRCALDKLKARLLGYEA